MPDDQRRPESGQLDRSRSSPLSRVSPPRKPGAHAESSTPPEPVFEAARASQEQTTSIGELAIAAFGLVGAATAMAMPAEAAVAQTIDQTSPDSLRDLDLSVETIDSVAEGVGETDIGPALESAARGGTSITFRISIETDGTADQIEAVRNILDAIEGMDSRMEGKTVWAELATKAHKGLEIAADIALGLAGIGSIRMAMKAGVKLLRRESDDENGESGKGSGEASLPGVIVIQAQPAKDEPESPLAAGVKSAEGMAKALRNLAKPLARIARDS